MNADFIALRVKVGAAVDALRMKLSQLWWFKKVVWQNMQGKVRSCVKREETDDLGVQMRFQMKMLSHHTVTEDCFSTLSLHKCSD